MSLGMVGLIDDVAPGGGAFTVWPRSHRRLFHTFEQQYSGGSITHNDSREEAEKAEYLLREKHMIIYISSESFNLPNQAPDLINPIRTLAPVFRSVYDRFVFIPGAGTSSSCSRSTRIPRPLTASGMLVSTR